MKVVRVLPIDKEFMVIFSDIKQRWMMAFNRSLPRERRVFAFLEAVFMPVSFLTLITLAGLPILGWCGVVVSGWFKGPLMTILVSAAVGYLTNWIAIEMLFKPYHPTSRHPFAWITFGYWRQGLVPKNKNQIAAVMGEQVATKLLQPEKMADDLCSMTGSILRNEKVIVSIRDSIQRMIIRHDKEIAAFLAPKIEAALVAEIDRLVTVERVEAFWEEHIEPKLQSVETREKIATIVIDTLEKRAPELAKKAKPLIVSTFVDYIEEKGGMVGELLAPLAEKLADALVSRKTLESGLCKWLKSPNTLPALRDELLRFVRSIRDYVKSEESRSEIGAFVEEIRSTFKEYVRSYLETNLAHISHQLLNSEALWASIVEMIPKFQPELERLIRTEGLPSIMQKLDIQGRIKTAVDKMDVAEFHGMINEVAAQHLGAIQVLGYLLGAVAGALTLLG